MIAAYKKPCPGDMLKTTGLVCLTGVVTNKMRMVKDGEIVLLLEILGPDKILVLYENQKYTHKQLAVARYFPFTIVS